jgi:hypothetical protein
MRQNFEEVPGFSPTLGAALRWDKCSITSQPRKRLWPETAIKRRAHFSFMTVGERAVQPFAFGSDSGPRPHPTVKTVELFADSPCGTFLFQWDI